MAIDENSIPQMLQLLNPVLQTRESCQAVGIHHIITRVLKWALVNTRQLTVLLNADFPFSASHVWEHFRLYLSLCLSSAFSQNGTWLDFKLALMAWNRSVITVSSSRWWDYGITGGRGSVCHRVGVQTRAFSWSFGIYDILTDFTQHTICTGITVEMVAGRRSLTSWWAH